MSAGRKGPPSDSLVERIRTSPRLRDPGWVLLPLRLFLGVTFVYAGVLKLTDPTYFDASSPNSVQAQMERAAQTSPIGPLVSLSAHASLVTGLAIAFGELAVGLGVLLGLWTRLAALGGLLLSLSFFLTVSWSTRPYFFGSDIVFVFAWTPILLAGDGGRFSVVSLLRAQAAEQLGVRPGRPVPAAQAQAVERRTVVRTGVLAATLGGLAAVLGGAAVADAHRRAVAAPGLAPTGGGTATPSPSGSGSSTSGTAIGPASQVPVGGAAQFTDPANGQPAFVVQPAQGTFKAFSAVCTHAGCQVEFQQGQFFCPCHASSFDGSTGAVLSGPAPSPLPSIPIHVTGGTIYEA